MQVHKDRQVDPDDGDEEVVWEVDPRLRPETYCMIIHSLRKGKGGHVVRITYARIR